VTSPERPELSSTTYEPGLVALRPT